MINIVTCLSFYDSKDLYRCLAFSVNSPCECFANQIEVYTRYIKVVLLVAGTWTEKKNVARWIFSISAHDIVYIKNPAYESPLMRGFLENGVFLTFPHEKTTF